MSAGDKPRLGIGIKIPGPEFRSTSLVAPLDLAKLTEWVEFVESAARQFGIEGKAQVFQCMYISV